MVKNRAYVTAVVAIALGAGGALVDCGGGNDATFPADASNGGSDATGSGGSAGGATDATPGDSSTGPGTDGGGTGGGSNDDHSNDAGSNEAGSNEAGSNDAGSNDAASNDGSSGDGTTNDAGSNDAGTTTDAGTDAGFDGPPAVRYFGRTITSGTSKVFDWSAAGFVFRFQGTGATVMMADQGDYFSVTVDGVAQAPLIGDSRTTPYTLATGLAAGVHTIEVARRTEASVVSGDTTVTSVDVTGTLLAPPTNTRKIEIVGDSISAGFGVYGTSKDCPFSIPTEDATMAYGFLTAAALGADVNVVAYSGKGVYENADTTTTDTIPDYYDLALPIDGTAWDPTQYEPDVVAIDLGTNDFYNGDPGTPFVTTYVNFVEHIHAVHPGAYIVLAIGPLLDGPELTETRADMTEIVSELNAAGITRLDQIEYPESGEADWGCQYHPNVQKQAAMAQQLEAELQKVLGW